MKVNKIEFAASSLPVAPAMIDSDVMRIDLKLGYFVANKFILNTELGRGSMGIVFAATDRVLAREVAIKFMLPKRATDDKLCERFLREARAAARLRGQHITRVYEVDICEHETSQGSETLDLGLRSGQVGSAFTGCGSPHQPESAPWYAAVHVSKIPQASGRATLEDSVLLPYAGFSSEPSVRPSSGQRQVALEWS